MRLQNKKQKILDKAIYLWYNCLIEVCKQTERSVFAQIRGCAWVDKIRGRLHTNKYLMPNRCRIRWGKNKKRFK